MNDRVRQFNENGFAVIPGVVSVSDCDAIAEWVSEVAGHTAGSRNALTYDWCKSLAVQLRNHEFLAHLLPLSAVAVQCTIFDKSSQKNWLVACHQDLSIPVRGRVANVQCIGWTEKNGQMFVQPPVPVLEDLVAVRVQLDSCGTDSGPLRVVPSSHRYGRLSPNAARTFKDKHREIECLVPKGGVLVMRPLLLHSSSKVKVPVRRRVLHFLFGPAALAHGLRWQHAV